MEKLAKSILEELDSVGEQLDLADWKDLCERVALGAQEKAQAAKEDMGL